MNFDEVYSAIDRVVLLWPWLMTGFLVGQRLWLKTANNQLAWIRLRQRLLSWANLFAVFINLYIFIFVVSLAVDAMMAWNSLRHIALLLAMLIGRLIIARQQNYLEHSRSPFAMPPRHDPSPRPR